MSLERDERIGPTAHYNAYVWHRLGLPHADLFVTRRGARLFWSFRLTVEWLAAVSARIPSMPQYLAIRHISFEDELSRIDPDRIVEIGAGLSRRGITWAAGDFRTWEDGRQIAAAVKVLRAGIRLVTRGRGARTDFATRSDVRAFFKEAGFASSDPFDHTLLPPHLARLPSPARVWHARAGCDPEAPRS